MQLFLKEPLSDTGGSAMKLRVPDYFDDFSDFVGGVVWLSVIINCGNY